MTRLIAALILALVPALAQAQLLNMQAASLPTSGPLGMTRVVNDGLTDVDCSTGGGKFRVLCTFDGLNKWVSDNNYKTSIHLKDEFLSGAVTTHAIGSLGWGFSLGTVTHVASEANRLGIIRRATSASSGTAALFGLSMNQTTLVDPALTLQYNMNSRLNTNDVNTSVRIGLVSSTSNPPAGGIYFEKLDADTDWFCVTRTGGVQTATRIDSTVAIETVSFHAFEFTRTAAGVQFYIDRVPVCGLMTANITTTFLAPMMFIINSAAADKTIDIDYFEMNIYGLAR